MDGTNSGLSASDIALMTGNNGLGGLEQRLTSKMDQNKIEALQNQVNKLQLDQATAGMLRFPNSWSYGAGPFPPMFGCCQGNGYSNI